MKLTVGTIIMAGSLMLGLGGYVVNASTKALNVSAASIAAVTSNWTNTTTNAANAVAPNSPLAPPERSGDPHGPSVMGKVTAVDGSTITVQDQRQQNSVTV